MRIPEFVGGFLVGLSFLTITIGIFFLTRFDQTLPPGNPASFELYVPYIAALTAGLAIGYGLRDDEGSYSFGGDINEQIPTLVGGVALAAALGFCILFFFSGSSTIGLVLALTSVFLAVLGLIISLVSWESSSF